MIRNWSIETGSVIANHPMKIRRIERHQRVNLHPYLRLPMHQGSHIPQRYLENTRNMRPWYGQQKESISNP